MANLQARYMGIDLKNPLIVGASSMTKNMDTIKKVAEKGAGALVIASLFEEQIAHQSYNLEEKAKLLDNQDAEMTDVFPDIEHSGPEEHLVWTRKAKESVDIPVIASLNARTQDTWVEWAKKLADTGVDGLELNFFATPSDVSSSGADEEKLQVEVVKAVSSAVKIPVSVKMSALYTNPVEMVGKLEKAGAKGVVLFNRFFHPSVDIQVEKTSFPWDLSKPEDRGLPLRFVSLCAGQTKASICASNGIHNGDQAIEMLLAGADVFQVVSTVYLNGFKRIKDILSRVEKWLEMKDYSSLDDVIGKVSLENSDNKWRFKRQQYVRMLLHSNDYVSLPNIKGD